VFEGARHFLTQIDDIERLTDKIEGAAVHRFGR
jgi:hypothetical protein